jgi:hypothetical protein
MTAVSGFDATADDTTIRLTPDPSVPSATKASVPKMPRRPRRKRPAPGPVGRNPITRLLLWCGGTDPDYLTTRVERYRYAGIGFFLILIALISGAMATVFASVIHGGFRPIFLVIAGGWSVLIFWADRSIVAEPKYVNMSDADAGDSDPAAADATNMVRRSRGTGGHLMRYVFRLVIALGGATVVVEAALLLVFHSEITQQLDATHNAQVRTAVSASKRPQTAQIAALQADEKSNDDRANAADAKAAAAENALAGEFNGTSGTHKPGYGPVARQRAAAAKRLEAQAKTIHGQVDAADRRDEQRIATLEAQRDQENVTTAKAIDDNRGWIAQEAALQEFLHANRGNLLVFLLPWILRATFLAIDLLPMSLKLFGKPTLYDRRVAAEAWLAAYRIARRRRTGKDAIDREIDMEQIKGATAYDVARHEENFIRASRLGHLRDGGW